MAASTLYLSELLQRLLITKLPNMKNVCIFLTHIIIIIIIII